MFQRRFSKLFAIRSCRAGELYKFIRVNFFHVLDESCFFVWVSDRYDVVFMTFGCRPNKDDIFGFEYGRHAGAGDSEQFTFS